MTLKYSWRPLAWTSTYLHKKDISICVCPRMYHKCLLLYVPAATGPNRKITSILRKESSFRDIHTSLPQSALSFEIIPIQQLTYISFLSTVLSASHWPPGEVFSNFLVLGLQFFLKITEDPQKLTFMYVIFVGIYHTRN